MTLQTVPRSVVLITVTLVSFVAAIEENRTGPMNTSFVGNEITGLEKVGLSAESLQAVRNLSHLHHQYILENRHWLRELDANLSQERQKRLNITCRSDRDLVIQYRKITQLDMALKSLQQTIRKELEESNRRINKVENETTQLRERYLQEEKGHENASANFEDLIKEQQNQILALEQLLFDIGQELSKEIETKGLKNKFNAQNEVLPKAQIESPTMRSRNVHARAHFPAHNVNKMSSREDNSRKRQTMQLANLQRSLLEERATRINLTLIVQKLEQRILKLENYIKKLKPTYFFAKNVRPSGLPLNAKKPAGESSHVTCVEQRYRVDQLEAMLDLEKRNHVTKSHQLAELSAALKKEVEQRAKTEQQFQSALQELNKHKFVDVYAEGIGLDDTQGLTKQAFAKVNGRVYSSRFSRGFNFLVLNGTTGSKMAHVCFDPFGKADDDDAVLHYVKNSVPFGAIVVVFTFDEASKNSFKSREALKLLGASDVDLTYRDAFALLGFKGHYKPNWVQQSLTKRRQGPAVVNSRIPLIY